MPEYTYLIVGAGMAAASAIQGIRKVDPQGSIGMIGRENQPPYARPPLTKGLWQGKPVEKIWLGAEGPGVMLHLGRNAQILDLERRQVTDNEGVAYSYDSLLLSTGGTPHKLPGAGERVIHYRTFTDYQNLRADAERSQQVMVIGGGFIGSELAAALSMNGKQVEMAFPEAGIGARLFPEDLALYLNDYYRQKGIHVFPGELVTGLEEDSGCHTITLKRVKDGSSHSVVADAVVAGIGIKPNTELAEGAGLSTDDGIWVNEYLQTGHKEVFAAGDAANFYSPDLGKRMRVEHEDNALTMGEIAGQNMAHLVKGESLLIYNHLPFFYSDLFDLGYEAVGDLDSRLETVADWQDPFQKGVIYYLRENRLAGVLLWNVWDQVPAARELIRLGSTYTPGELIGRLPA